MLRASPKIIRSMEQTFGVMLPITMALATPFGVDYKGARDSVRQLQNGLSQRNPCVYGMSESAAFFSCKEQESHLKIRASVITGRRYYYVEGIENPNIA